MTKDTQTKSKRSVRNSGQYADTIRSLRLEAGLTQPQLAERLGVTKNAISNWEAGTTRPDIETIPVLCDALRVTADELLGHDTQVMNLSEQRFLRKFRRLSQYDQKAISDMKRDSILQDYQYFVGSTQGFPKDQGILQSMTEDGMVFIK